MTEQPWPALSLALDPEVAELCGLMTPENPVHRGGLFSFVLLHGLYHGLREEGDHLTALHVAAVLRHIVTEEHWAAFVLAHAELADAGVETGAYD